MSPIKAIIFDYGNVIARFDVELYLRGILPYSSFSPQELIVSMKASAPVVAAYETGDISSEEFFEKISRNCSLKIARKDFLKAYNGIFEPVVSTQSLIKGLHGRYRLGLLSNTSEWHFQNEISRNPVYPLFEAVTLSHEVRARKPSEAIYRDILRKLDLTPGECVYIDDIPEFAGAATQLGMHGIRYTTHEDLVNALDALGIR